MKGARTRTRRIDENWAHGNSLSDIVSDVRKTLLLNRQLLRSSRLGLKQFPG